MYKPFIAIIFLFLPFVTIGQASLAILNGIVKEANGKPISFASISLVLVNDSSEVKSVISNSTGSFEIKEIKTGKYLLFATAIGYKPATGIAIDIASAKAYTQDITLTLEDKNLEEVKVISRKPPIQIKADRTILNVAASINSTGYSAFELLAKAPGVRIINGEEVLINGKSGLSVYLDGRLLQIQGREIIDFLQTLQAANIEQIEIITHPSARYDAAGSAGVINIKTKKILNLGMNGSATFTGIATSFKPKAEGSSNINYRQQKYNLFGNYSYSGGNYRSLLEDERAQEIMNRGTIGFSQHFRGVFSRKIHNYKAGADFFLSKKSTIGVVVNGGYTNWLYNRSSITDIYKTSAKIDSQLVSKTIQPKTYNNQNYNVNYLYQDSLGREFNIDVSYGKHRTLANTDQSNNYINGLQLLRTNANTNLNDADITIAAAKADYAQKLWNGNVSVGAKASKVQSDNDLLFYNIINNTPRPDTGRTNHFLYTEKIIAAYLNYNFSVKNFDFQTGLRLEHTASRGDLTTILSHTAQAVDTTYTSLFPNVVINYKLNGDNNLGLAVGRRINRPPYQSLNPFEFVLDELSYIKGNPFLKPKTSYDIKLLYSFKSVLTSSISYSVTQNFFLNYRDTLAGGKTFSSTVNAGTQRFFSANAALQISPLPWWDLMISAEAFYQMVNGRVNQILLKQGQLAWESSYSNTFRMSKQWSAEVSGYYNSRYYDAPAIVKPQWTMDAGIQYKIWKDEGVLRFNATDIFYTLKFSLDRNYGGLYYKMTNRYESRQYRLTFSYKFGNKNIKANRRQTSSAVEEQKRVSQ